MVPILLFFHTTILSLPLNDTRSVIRSYLLDGCQYVDYTNPVQSLDPLIRLSVESQTSICLLYSSFLTSYISKDTIASTLLRH